jgi:hypothetical protein
MILHHHVNRQVIESQIDYRVLKLLKIIEIEMKFKYDADIGLIFYKR